MQCATLTAGGCGSCGGVERAGGQGGRCLANRAGIEGAVRGGRTWCVAAERDRLQLGEPLASASVAAEDRQSDLDQLATALGENRQAADQARPVLLAPVGRESSHATLVWSRAGQDRSAALASGVGEPPTRPDFKRRAGRTERCRRNRSREAGSRFVILGSGKTGPYRGRWRL